MLSILIPQTGAGLFSVPEKAVTIYHLLVSLSDSWGQQLSNHLDKNGSRVCETFLEPFVGNSIKLKAKRFKITEQHVLLLYGTHIPIEAEEDGRVVFSTQHYACLAFRFFLFGWYQIGLGAQCNCLSLQIVHKGIFLSRVSLYRVAEPLTSKFWKSCIRRLEHLPLFFCSPGEPAKVLVSVT